MIESQYMFSEGEKDDKEGGRQESRDYRFAEECNELSQGT
jgi:hypothetical protein